MMPRYFLDRKEAVPQRRNRRRLGLCGPVPETDDRGRPQRKHDLREVFNPLRRVLRIGPTGGEHRPANGNPQ